MTDSTQIITKKLKFSLSNLQSEALDASAPEPPESARIESWMDHQLNNEEAEYVAFLVSTYREWQELYLDIAAQRMAESRNRCIALAEENFSGNDVAEKCAAVISLEDAGCESHDILLTALDDENPFVRFLADAVVRKSHNAPKVAATTKTHLEEATQYVRSLRRRTVATLGSKFPDSEFLDLPQSVLAVAEVAAVEPRLASAVLSIVAHRAVEETAPSQFTAAFLAAGESAFEWCMRRSLDGDGVDTSGVLRGLALLLKHPGKVRLQAARELAFRCVHDKREVLTEKTESTDVLNSLKPEEKSLLLKPLAKIFRQNQDLGIPICRVLSVLKPSVAELDIVRSLFSSRNGGVQAALLSLCAESNKADPGGRVSPRIRASIVSLATRIRRPGSDWHPLRWFVPAAAVDFNVQQDALMTIRELRFLDEETVVDKLATLSDSDNQLIAALAISNLGASRSPTALQQLTRMATQTSKANHIDAIKALGTRPEATVLDTLQECLFSSSDKTRQAALKAIMKKSCISPLWVLSQFTGIHGKEDHGALVLALEDSIDKELKSLLRPLLVRIERDTTAGKELRRLVRRFYPDECNAWEPAKHPDSDSETVNFGIGETRNDDVFADITSSSTERLSGKILLLFPDQRCGMIRCDKLAREGDGKALFEAGSVWGGQFGQLSVGDEVDFIVDRDTPNKAVAVCHRPFRRSK